MTELDTSVPPSELEIPELEVIAKAIYDENPALQLWNGEPYGYNEDAVRDHEKRKLALVQAQAVYATIYPPKFNGANYEAEITATVKAVREVVKNTAKPLYVNELVNEVSKVNTVPTKIGIVVAELENLAREGKVTYKNVRRLSPEGNIIYDGNQVIAPINDEA
jgi:predicted metallopeptidase